VALNIAFLISFAGPAARKFTLHDWIIMPDLRGNAYQSLGRWFARNAAPNDSIAYAEFGKLRYYSGNRIVDYLGLVSPGVAAHLQNDDGI
jgi:hypothetical protein